MMNKLNNNNSLNHHKNPTDIVNLPINNYLNNNTIKLMTMIIQIKKK